LCPRDFSCSTFGCLARAFVDTKVNTFAPPQGVSGESHTTEARNAEQVTVLNRYYGALKVNFTAECTIRFKLGTASLWRFTGSNPPAPIPIFSERCFFQLVVDEA
jgi:hypothetical protein